MSAVTKSQVQGTVVDSEDDDNDGPWWKDRGIMVPVFSGVAFLSGLICEWSGAEIPALVLFWIGLLLGASTFTPGAIRKLLKGKLGIGLLMTISAVGAVILGYVEEAAALAFLYSIAEALEDKAMDRARGGRRHGGRGGHGVVAGHHVHAEDPGNDGQNRGQPARTAQEGHHKALR